MKNYIIRLGILLAALLTVFTSSAYDFEVDGIYYNFISTKDLTCSVAGLVDKNYSGDLCIPEEVSYRDRQIKVISIDSYVFRLCTSLKSVTIPNSITVIDCFQDCSCLESVTIPNSVTWIRASAFRGCSSLKSVTIPNSVKTIDESAFSGCSSLESVNISNSLETIEPYTFSNCTSLKSVTIPDSVKTIRSHAFYNCSSLESINFSNNLEVLNFHAFEGCYNLKPFEVSESVESIIQNDYRCDTGYDYNYSDYKCFSKLKLEYSPNKLESAVISSSDGYSNTIWYSDWTNLIEELYIDRDLEEDIISLDNLKKLEIGKHLSSGYVPIYTALRNLEVIYSYANEPPKFYCYFTNEQYLNLPVYVPENAIEAYKEDTQWGKFWNIQPLEQVGVKDNVEADSDDTVHIYTIHGIEMTDKENLPGGIYILRQGMKSRKIVVK